MVELLTRTICRLCNSQNLKKVLSLEPTTIADHYWEKEQSDTFDKFPLDLYLCKECGHVQMLDSVKPDILFRNYIFETSSSAGLIEHFKEAASKISVLCKSDQTNLVVEIGSNDGTMLSFFKEKGFKVLGVDPAINIADKATESGIETIPEFFSQNIAEKIYDRYGKALIVLANNVFAHVDDIQDISQGIKKILSPEGIFVFEVSYLEDILDNMLFDTIYHEHLSYHSIKPLKKFFEKNGLEIFDVERIPTKGGSIRVYVQHKNGPKEISQRVGKLVIREEEKRLDDEKTFEIYLQKINSMKAEFFEALSKLKEKNKKIAGYGISPTANTLMYHFKLHQFLSKIYDDNPSKQGLFLPNEGIPIISSENIYSDPPDYIVVLAWNYSSKIIEKHKKYLQNGGKFIIPLPEFKIIS